MFDFTPIHRSFGKLDLTDTGEDSKVRVETCLQAKTSKSGHAISFSFFSTRPSDKYDVYGAESTRESFSPVSVKHDFSISKPKLFIQIRV